MKEYKIIEVLFRFSEIFEEALTCEVIAVDGVEHIRTVSLTVQEIRILLFPRSFIHFQTNTTTINRLFRK